MLLFSRQGKLRLQKWYTATTQKDKKKITRELITTVLARKPKMCSFLEYKDLKVVYKRYVVAAAKICRSSICKLGFGMQGAKGLQFTNDKSQKGRTKLRLFCRPMSMT